MHRYGLGMGIGETRKDQELPRISVNISAEMEAFLKESSASEKRSVSSQASVLLDSHAVFLGWKSINRSPTWKAIQAAVKERAE